MCDNVTTCRGCSKRGKVTWALVSRLTAHWTDLQSPVPPEVTQILPPGDQRHSYQIEYSKGLEVAFEEQGKGLSFFGMYRVWTTCKVDISLYSSIKTTRVLIQKLRYSKCKGCLNVNVSVLSPLCHPDISRLNSPNRCNAFSVESDFFFLVVFLISRTSFDKWRTELHLIKYVPYM